MMPEVPFSVYLGDEHLESELWHLLLIQVNYDKFKVLHLFVNH
jgi:hypothetical protein